MIPTQPQPDRPASLRATCCARPAASRRRAPRRPRLRRADRERRRASEPPRAPGRPPRRRAESRSKRRPTCEWFPILMSPQRKQRFPIPCLRCGLGSDLNLRQLPRVAAVAVVPLFDRGARVNELPLLRVPLERLASPVGDVAEVAYGHRSGPNLYIADWPLARLDARQPVALVARRLVQVDVFLAQRRLDDLFRPA